MTPVRVLVVDDHPAFRSTAARVVEATEGFELSGTADSGAVALDLLDDDPTIDLVLADVHMPGMDGVELAGRYRTAGGDAPVVLMSTSTLDELAVDARVDPIAGFLPKASLSPGALTAVWHTIVDLRR